MTESNNENTGRNDDKLESAFKIASRDEWIPLPGFTERVLARLEGEESITLTIEKIALRFIPLTFAVSAAAMIVALIGESFESLIVSSTLNPFAFEGIVAFLGG